MPPSYFGKCSLIVQIVGKMVVIFGQMAKAVNQKPVMVGEMGRVIFISLM